MNFKSWTKAQLIAYIYAQEKRQHEQRDMNHNYAAKLQEKISELESKSSGDVYAQRDNAYDALANLREYLETYNAALELPPTHVARREYESALDTITDALIDKTDARPL